MIELGLGRIGRLVRNTPQSWKAIHVAGTNGKGSICASLSAMLHASGVRCGRFTSPHLIHRWDCITINEQAVPESIFHEAEDAVKHRDQAEEIGASEFELLTATAFEIFAREKIEMGVVEVGLGGKLDATNILENKIVTVISKIGMDHEQFLGNTLEAIALQKAGILRPHIPCVLDKSNPESVRAVIRKYGKEIGGVPMFYNIAIGPQICEISDELAKDGYEPHQWENLLCALKAFFLTDAKQNASSQQIISAIRDLKWPGRLQVTNIRKLTGREEDVLLDGAHNSQSAEALGRYVDGRLRVNQEQVTWVFAASSGKDLTGILSPLLREGDYITSVEFGPVDGMPWVKPMKSSDILAAASKAGIDQSHQNDSGHNLLRALKWASEISFGGPVVIAGSLYLVSDFLRLQEELGHHD